MKRLVFVAVSAAVGAAIAGTAVYRLELTDEIPYIVGQDGVKREVAIIDPAQYAMMTGRVQSVWTSLNSTRDGRVKLHGKCTGCVIDDAAKEKRETYADGYVWREPMLLKTRKVVGEIKDGDHAKPKRPKERPRHLSKMQWEMRQKLESARSGKVRHVTVIHDAATGKDVVK